jgi:hypothetical protein
MSPKEEAMAIFSKEYDEWITSQQTTSVKLSLFETRLTKRFQ